jgi:hypothetical protein
MTEALDTGTALLQQLVGLLTAQKAVSTTPTTTYAHGNGGLLSAPGLSKDIINAMLLPHMGVQSRLPATRATSRTRCTPS